MSMRFLRRRGQSSTASDIRPAKRPSECVLQKRTTALRFAVERLELRTLLSISTYPVDLSLNGQGLFGTNSGTGTSFNFNQFLGVNYPGNNAPASSDLLSAIASLGPTKIGFQLFGSGGLGSANIPDYPLNLKLSAPGTAAPGSTVSVSTSTASNAASYTLNTTVTSIPSAELDFVLDGSVSASLNYGSLQLYSNTLHITRTHPLVTLGAGQFGGSLSAGPLQLTLAPPDLPALSAVSPVGSAANPSGQGHDFLSASLDISQLISDATDVPLDYSGSGLGVSWQLALLKIEMDAGLPLTEAVQYVPQVSITLTSSDGQTHTGLLGQSFNFTMPASGSLNLSASVQLGGTLQTTVGLGGNLSINLQALVASADIFLLGNHGIGPAWSATPYSASGNLINLLSIPSFSLSNSSSVAPIKSISNAIQITALDGTPPAPVMPSQQTITSVGSSTLPVSPNRQLLRIFGSGFTPSTTLLFNVGGQSISSTSTFLQYISPAEIDYNIAVGSTAAPWTVQVVNGGVPSNSAGFNVVVAPTDVTPPAGNLSFPVNGGSVTQSILNSGGFIQITYSDSGSGVDPTTITGIAPKITLSGTAAAGVTLSQTPPVLVADTSSTYRYGFTGSFGTGLATVNFSAGAAKDNAGNASLGATQSFTVTSGALQTGAFQETITPQAAISAGAQWNIDGGSYLTSGAVVSGLTVGTHIVQFKAISGWNTPPAQTVTVVASQTTGDTAAYSQQQGGPYSLLVASSNGNVTRNVYASSYSAGTAVTLIVQPDVGYHFTGWSGDVSGSQNPLTVTMNSNMSITANYAVGDLTHGSLQVTVSPQAAVTAGGYWSIDGGQTYYQSGATLQGLTPGQYIVQYRPLGGYTKPANQTVNVLAGQIAPVTGTYIPDPQFGLIQVGISPPAAITAGAQWRLDGGSWQNNAVTLSNVPIGSHMIQFEPVSGWATPADQTVQVSVNQTLLLSGIYIPQTGVPIISSISPSTAPLAGGTRVIIRGANFASPATVTFDGVASTSISVDSAAQITAIAPPRNSYGTVPVVVTVPTGSATNANGFTYAIPRGVNLELAGQVGGVPNTVAVQGNYAYIGEGAGLNVLNISDPAHPAPIGHVALPGMADDVVVVGQYAYVADDDAGLQIVDVSVPTAPKICGFYTTPGLALGVTTLGGLAYLADGHSGLQILDITNPIAPTFVGAASTPGLATNVVVGVSATGVVAYITDGDLEVVNVADPAHPAPAVTVSTPGVTNNIVLNGSRAYVVDNGSGVNIYNLDSPLSPNLLSTFPVQVPLNGIAYSNNRVYVVYAFNDVMAIDMSNPSAPAQGPVYYNPPIGGAIPLNPLFAVGSLVYTARTNGMQVFDVSNSNSITLKGSYIGQTGLVNKVDSSGSVVSLLTNNGSQFVTIDASNPGAPFSRGVYASFSNGGPNTLSVVGSRAYVAGVNLDVLDLSNPSSPTLLGTYTGMYVYKVLVVGSTAYAIGSNRSTGTPEFAALNVSNPASITMTSSINIPGPIGEAVGGAIHGSLAYVVDNAGGMQVIDLSNPGTLHLRGSLQGYDTGIALSDDGNYAFITDSQSSIVQIVDVRNPDLPSLVTTYDVGDSGMAVAVSNGLVYVAASTVGVKVLDCSDPSHPNMIASYDTPWSAQDVSVTGDYVYVADGNAGLAVLHQLDITPPTVFIANPTFNPMYPTTSGTLNIGGTASDNENLARVIWSNDRGGSGDAVGTDSWTVSGIALQPGQNVLTVTAIDAAGNVGTDVLTISYTPVQASQTVTFPSLSNGTFGDAPVALNATTTSGLPVSFSVVSGPATVSNSVLTLTGAGTVIVRASQAGNVYYGAATNIDQTFTVAKSNQTITVSTIGNKGFGEAPFVVDARSTSGLAVTISVLSGPATVSGNVVTLLGAGTVQLRTSQAGDANYNASSNVDVSFTVAKASQMISFAPLNTQTLGDAPFPVTATADSGLPVAFGILSGPATIAGNVVTITGTGTVAIMASQAGDPNFISAPNTTQSLVVSLPDTTPPAVTAANQLYQTAPNKLSFTFGENISSILSAGTITVTNLSSGASVNGITHDFSGNTATFTLPTTLSDGNYHVTLPAGSISDLAGNAMTSPSSFDFFIYAGDANHDRHVDMNDLYILSQNWLSSGKTFAQGDFNYDGTVDARDLGILSLRWQQTLSPPGPTAPATPTMSNPTVVGQQINLSWTEPPSNQSGFRVERKIGPNGTYSQIADLSGTTLNDTNVTPGNVYYYHVYAYNGGGSSVISNEVNATVAAPANLVTNLTTTTGQTYDLKTATVNAIAYTDRTYTISALTSNLLNGTLVRTANADKSNTTANAMSFTVTSAATVYVAYDGRATKLPAWLTGFTLTSESITIPGSTTTPYKVYSKTVAANATVTLGGNLQSPASGAQANYLVIVQSATPTIPSIPTNFVATAGNQQVALQWAASAGATTYNLYRSVGSPGGEGNTPFKTGLTGTSFTDTGLTNGQTYYYKLTAVNSAGESGRSSETSGLPQAPSSLVTNLTTTTGQTYDLKTATVNAVAYTDRTYTISSLTSNLLNGILIRTANADKSNTSANAMSFTVTSAATVYVAYDARATKIPAWLSGFILTSESITVPGSSTTPFKVYSKTVAANTVVTLGGNLQSPAAGAQSNYLVIVK